MNTANHQPLMDVVSPHGVAIERDGATGIHIHSHALCESNEIGEGTRIWAFAHVLPGARIGRECNICDHSFVEGGAVIGDHVTVKNHVLIWDGVTVEDNVFLGPAMMFTNDAYPRSRGLAEAASRYSKDTNWLAPTTVRYGATIGAGAIVLGGVTVGRYAAIGAGAVVTHNVPDHGLVVGQPARMAGWMCFCGVSLDKELRCERCNRAFHLEDSELKAVV